MGDVCWRIVVLTTQPAILFRGSAGERRARHEGNNGLDYRGRHSVRQEFILLSFPIFYKNLTEWLTGIEGREGGRSVVLSTFFW
jgi:hypothetical protein